MVARFGSRNKLTLSGSKGSPDGRWVFYYRFTANKETIWKVPFDGGAAKQLTDFKSDRIYWFALSRDGKQLAVCHGPSTADVILISNAK